MKQSVQEHNREPDYSHEPLEADQLEPNPIVQFGKWLHEAWNEDYPMPHAMSLATATSDGQPTIRTVLLKSYDFDGFVFYTNYSSVKAKQIRENPTVSLLFPWVRLGRQVIITGRIKKVSKQESQEYFDSRPRESQLSAWASTQSKAISSRTILESAYSDMQRRFKDKKVPLPDFWGGYRVDAQCIEFWQNRKDRLHDRFLYTRKNNELWDIDRLMP